MEVKIDEEHMRALMTKAVLEGLGQDQRDLIFQKAVESLFQRARPNDYYDKRTKLEVAFDQAASGLMLSIATEELRKPEHTDRLRSIFDEAIAKVFESEGRKKLVETIANAMFVGLRGDS